jgi:hypothetical protein
MNEDKLIFGAKVLKHFVNNALGLDYEHYEITGYELLYPLMDASSHYTYVETVSDKADTLYRRTKESLINMMLYSYLNYIRRVSEKLELSQEEVILAFDYTDEDFYGDVQGLDIHGWTGKDAVTGHFKFLTCSIVSKNAPYKIPLISVPIHMGHIKSQVILYCISQIKNYVGKIRLLLFDKQFIDNDLMYELTQHKYQFLMLGKRTKENVWFFKQLEEEKTILVKEYEVNKNFSKYEGENYVIFLKGIFDPRSEKNLDWIFITNSEKVALDELIKEYKQRWGIEIQFKIEDEALIKCKSKEMKVRYFLFLFEQMLHVMWACFYKEEGSFKEFIIAMTNVSNKWTKNQSK